VTHPDSPALFPRVRSSPTRRILDHWNRCCRTLVGNVVRLAEDSRRSAGSRARLNLKLNL
jgi:hypothetical protein